MRLIVSNLLMGYMSSVSRSIKLLWLNCLGVVFELYDYVLFVVMVPFFAKDFFTPLPEHLQMLAGYILFAIAFVFSCIGSIIWGFIGDKYGRTRLLQLAPFYMAIPSVLLVILPDYTVLGIFAPILLLCLRILQAISASGEIQGAKIFFMEHLGFKRLGLASAAVSAAASLGVMMAMVMGYLCSLYQHIPGVWRIPFAFGSLLIIVATITRRMLLRTTDSKPQPNVRYRDLLQVLLYQPKATIMSISLSALLGLFSYFMHGFINPFLIAHGADKTNIYSYSIIAMACSIIGSLSAGWYLDRSQQWLKTILLMFAIIIALLPAMYYFTLHGVMLVYWYMLAGFMLGAYAVIATIFINLAFIGEHRCRGALFTYAIGVAVVGGLTPFTLNYCANIALLLPVYVLLALSLFLTTVIFYTIRYLKNHAISHLPPQ